jgi:CRP-like cAMP-binding protein
VATELLNPGDKITTLYFPTSCLISILTVLKGGQSIEACAIGNEGVFGVEALLGAPRALNRIVVQIPGQCLALPLRDLKRLLEDRPRIASLLMLAVAYRLGDLGQRTACSAAHDSKQRAAFWLLRASDAIGSDTLRLTQEFLAAMLGTRRPTVTLTAQELRSEGLITYSRGLIKVVDREGLREAACECFNATSEAWAQTVGHYRSNSWVSAN